MDPPKIYLNGPDEPKRPTPKENFGIEDYIKYYDDFPPPTPNTPLAFIDFDRMEANDLAGMAYAIEQTRVQDFENDMLYVHAQYHVYRKTEKFGNLILAIKKLQYRLGTIDSTDSRYEAAVRTLVFLLYQKYRYTGEVEDLEDAVYQAQMFLSMTDRLDLERYPRQGGLMALLARYAGLTGNHGPLDDLVESTRILSSDAIRAIEALPNGDTLLPGDKSALIEKLKDGIGAMPPTFEGRNIALDKLGYIAFLHWKDHPRDQKLLEEAIKMGELALPACPNTEGKALRLIALSDCLGFRYEQFSHNLDDLNSAISRIEEAIIASAGKYPPEYLKSLHQFLTLRFGQTNRIYDLERAVRLLERLISKLEPGNENIPQWQDHLSINLSTLAQTQKGADALKMLDRAIQLNTEVLKYIDKHPDGEGVTRWLNNYANRLGARYEFNNSIEDLKLADRLFERAVSYPYDKRDDRPRYLSSYAIHCVKNYIYLGDMRHLDEAIRRGNEALSQGLSLYTETGHFPEKAQLLHTVQNALSHKFEATGDLDLLKEAIKRGEEAIAYALPLEPQKHKFYNNLAGDYLQFYERSHDPEDLFRAVERQKEALRLTPPGHKDRPLSCIRMSQILHVRYQFDRKAYPSDLDDATAFVEESVATTADGDWQKPRRMGLLGQFLRIKWEETGDLEALNKAIALSRESGKHRKEDTPTAAEELYAVARTFLHRYNYLHDPNDLAEAITNAKAGLSHTFSSIHTRIQCGTFAAELYHQERRHLEAADIAEQTVRLLPSVSSRALKQTDQQHMLKKFAGLTTTAVASAFEAGKSVSHCLELLEFGRGIINGLRFDSRVDVSALERKDPELAREFVSLKNELEKQDLGTAPVELTELWGEGESVKPTRSQKHEATRKFQEMLLKIRKLEGLESFMAPPCVDDLKKASRSSKEVIVIINASFRSDAIIVQNGEIQHLHLPDLRTDDIDLSVKEMIYIRRGRGAPAQGRRRLSRMLGWLWVSLVCPVLDKLGFTTTPVANEWPRVWWIPTGALSQLPLHAAGYHSAGSSESALDRVISSYSPSIKALLYTRRNQTMRDPKVAGNSILLACVQKAEGQNPLPYAKEETETLASLIPGDLKTICINEPNKQDIISRLPSCAVFHFAGHGTSNPSDPLDSCLLVKDWKKDPLSVKDLIGLDLYVQSPWLAYLSACSTGESRDNRLYDESIHLMSGCQLAGFQHVVGSLWEISDLYSVDVAREVYKSLGDGIGTTGNVAYAVHQAVRYLRDLSFAIGVRRDMESVETSLPEASMDGADDWLDLRGIVATPEGHMST